MRAIEAQPRHAGGRGSPARAVPVTGRGDERGEPGGAPRPEAAHHPGGGGRLPPGHRPAAGAAGGDAGLRRRCGRCAAGAVSRPCACCSSAGSTSSWRWSGSPPCSCSGWSAGSGGHARLLRGAHLRPPGVVGGHPASAPCVSCSGWAWTSRGTRSIAPGPVVLMMRHASLVDTLLPTVLVLRRHRIRLRYVLKRELLWDPALDLAGNVLPNYFLDRASTRRRCRGGPGALAGGGPRGERRGADLPRGHPLHAGEAGADHRDPAATLPPPGGAGRGAARRAGPAPGGGAGPAGGRHRRGGLRPRGPGRPLPRQARLAGRPGGGHGEGGLLAHPGGGDPRRARRPASTGCSPSGGGWTTGCAPTAPSPAPSRRERRPRLVPGRPAAGRQPGLGRRHLGTREVVALFVVDPGLWDRSGEHRRNQLAAHLGALDTVAAVAGRPAAGAARRPGPGGPRRGGRLRARSGSTGTAM